MMHEGSIEDAAFVLALRGRGMRDTDTLRAMERVPRERFAPARHRDLARRDLALPLACGQTMTAPTTVAAMLTALALRPGARILEIGTGSGYVTALLLRLGRGPCHSVERYATLADEARDNLVPEDRPLAEIAVGDGLHPATPAGGGALRPHPPQRHGVGDSGSPRATCSAPAAASSPRSAGPRRRASSPGRGGRTAPWTRAPARPSGWRRSPRGAPASCRAKGSRESPAPAQTW